MVSSPSSSMVQTKPCNVEEVFCNHLQIGNYHDRFRQSFADIADIYKDTEKAIS